MNHRLRAIGLILILTLPALGASQIVAPYVKGTMEIRPDPEFGKDTDWLRFIQGEINGLAVAPDGSLFLTQQKAHVIHKFDRSGRLVKSFGRKGQGPGDFQFPQFLSILDERFLVVGEQGESRRISLFDLDGTFVKLMKTGRNPFMVTALRDGIVAYIVKSFPRRGSLVLVDSQVILLDTATGLETAICPHSDFVSEDQVFASPGGAPPKGEFGTGTMVIARISCGDLAVGYTTSPKIKVFSPSGKAIREIVLDYPPLEWTDEIWSRWQEAQIETMIERTPQSDPKAIRQRISARPRLSRLIPYFHDILSDGEGRLLVVRRGECFRSCDREIRIYSPEGLFLSPLILREGAHTIEFDTRSRNLIFAPEALYGVFRVKNSPDDDRVLLRVPYR
ncbi:MAG: hypothetical protein JW843_09840 [Candidatus Aminicenantes bacterium]|nr:hypothetical protein [Candidatus Aminicenantes bacterium]